MTFTNQALSSLTSQIESSVRKMYYDCIENKPNGVSCVAIESSELIISIKREYSDTEKFLLRQKRLDLYNDVEKAVVQILGEKLLQLLEQSFGLSVAHITPVMSFSPHTLKWVVLIRS